MDTGATHSIIRPDVVRGTVEPLVGCKLRTATGEEAAVAGKVFCEVMIGTLEVNHTFIVAEITDEIIMGVDFMIDHGVTLDLNKQMLFCQNMEMPINTGYVTNVESKRVIVDDNQSIPPKSEAIVWAKVNGGGGTEELWIVEPTKIDTPILVGRTLVKTREDATIPVRVVNEFNTPISLKKGAVIGQCQNISAIARCERSQQKPTIEPQQISPTLLNNLLNELHGNEKLKAEKLLEKYASIFANEGNTGRTGIVKHRINTGDAKPIRQTPRRVPLAKREDANKIIEDMHKNGVIEPSISPWSSPIVLVKKKDGSTRFCVDYRKLNDVTKKDSYPLPRIDDTLDTLSGAKWFSTLDLQSGYWQVEIDECDREKTAFSMGDGLWEFSVMPFGLCNAPATFERLMEHVLKGLNWKTCLVYLDDIIIMGKSFDDHLKNLEEVFQRIASAGLRLNPKKCSLWKKQVTYLGHKVSTEGIHTEEGKIKAVKDWPRPTNIHELRSFLGLCTYYRRFVPGFANVARSLHDLTKKNRPFVWQLEQEKAFEQLKELLCTAPMLAYPIPGKKFILDTDASAYGIGGVLSQLIDGQERVIGYYSRVLGKPEKNYCVTRKELLAVVECVKHFHKYLYGQRFLLRTDHAALKWLLQFKNPEGQIARWIERLQNYDFETEHRKGIHHKNADALSRRPCPLECKHCSKSEGKEGIIDVRLLNIEPEDDWTPHRIRINQLEDPDLAKLIIAKENGVRPPKEQISNESPTAKAYWAQWNSINLVNGYLHRTWESEDGKQSRLLIIVPKSMIPKVLKEYHNGPSGGHLGITKTIEKIKQRFYWIGCRDSIAEWISNCVECMAAKGPKAKSRGRLQQYNVGSPFERVAMDVAGPFPTSTAGNKYLLVVMDYFSKWPEVYALPNQEAKTVAEAFVENWITRFGVPVELHSDQGRNFESSIFQEVCTLLGIHKTRTTALHPQSDGMVERFNRTLEEHLRKIVDKDQRNWDKCIQMFLLAYRSAKHETTGYTPAKIIFGSDLRLPADLKFGTNPTAVRNDGDYCSALKEEMNELHLMVRQHTHLMSNKMKDRFDQAANSKGFEEGDLVLLYNPLRKKGLSPKLQTAWEGPYMVMKRLNDVVYRIQRNGKARCKMKVVHLERLAPFGSRGFVPNRDD